MVDMTNETLDPVTDAYDPDTDEFDPAAVVDPPAADWPPPPDPALTAPASAEPDPPKRRHGGHIASIVIGAMATLGGLAMVGGGVTAVVAAEVAADDGYFEIGAERLVSEGAAVTSIELWEEVDAEDAPAFLDWADVDIRLRVDGANDGEVFVGIARSADVEQYLDGASYDDVIDIDDRVEYRTHTGTAALAPPVDQGFWAATASGPGELELEWEVRNGDWTVVVMNADGSSDVAADVELGMASGAIVPIGIVAIVLGSIGVLLGAGLLVFGIRGRRDP